MKQFALAALATLALTGCGMEQIEEGNRGVYQNWGKVEGEPLTPGLHFYNPFTSSILELTVREVKLEQTTSSFTKDTQNVNVTFAMTYSPDPTKIGVLYSTKGREWADQVVVPETLGAIKDVIGQYIADDLVSKREMAKMAIFNELKTKLSERSVTLTSFNFTNLDFDDAYEKAVEQKVVAIQKAAEAKNHTVEVEEQAKQTVASATADATAMRIKSAALAQNKGLVEFELAKRWDGKLPEIMLGQSTPLLDLSAITNKKSGG